MTTRRDRFGLSAFRPHHEEIVAPRWPVGRPLAFIAFASALLTMCRPRVQSAMGRRGLDPVVDRRGPCRASENYRFPGTPFRLGFETPGP